MKRRQYDIDHWPTFLEFSGHEISSGGPDHHVTMASEALQLANDKREQAWRVGCYIGPYEISTGSIIWEEWPQEEVGKNPEAFTQWISDTWEYWQVNRERRAARTPKKMAASMLSYWQWIDTLIQNTDNTYDYLWDSAMENLIYVGRYAGIKILETLHRSGFISSPMHDIRPHGAWSPRLTLSWLFPNEPLIIKGDKPANIAATNHYVDILKNRVSDHIGREATYFEIEVLLCNYRQVLDENNGRYAGWPLDYDLEHRIIAEKWKVPEFPFYDIRRERFPHLHLGEIQGWNYSRKNLGGFRNYFWSDLVYDYHATKDYANPVRR